MSRETYYFDYELEELAARERWPQQAMEELAAVTLRKEGLRWWVNKEQFAELRQGWRGKAAPRGVGDLLENLFLRTGVKSVVLFATRWVGRDCGCEERRDWMNRHLPHLTRYGKSSDACY